MREALPLRPDRAPTVEDLRKCPEAARPASLVAPAEQVLVPAAEAARLCAIGRATWFRLRSAGKTPAPVKLAGRVLYRVEDLRLWVSLGSPPQKEFESRPRPANANGRPRYSASPTPLDPP